MTPPHNIEAEAALIGALMQANRLIPAVADILAPQDFAEPLHGRLFTAILAQSARGEAANPVTVKHLLADDPALKALGGPAWLVSLATNAAAAMGTLSFAAQVKDCARRRQLIDGLHSAIAAAADTGAQSSLEQAIELADTGLNAALAGKGKHNSLSLSDAFDRTLAQLDSIAAGTADPGISIAGFNDWNRVTGVMRPGENIILAGRPSMGKTAVALEIALGAARAGHGALFLSLEMSVDELMARAIASLIHDKAQDSARFDQVRRGDFSAFDRRQLKRVREELQSWPLILTDRSDLSIARLPQLIRQYQRQMAAKGQELRLVVTDYLQLIRPTGGYHGRSRHDQVSEISKALKQTARECNVACVTLSQLSRGVEGREDKRPMLSDLRESGSIEEDADTVVFVYRDQYYLERAEPRTGMKRHADWQVEMAAARNRLDLICAKLRNGRVGTRRSWFFAAHQAVRDGDHYRSDMAEGA